MAIDKTGTSTIIYSISQTHSGQHWQMPLTLVVTVTLHAYVKILLFFSLC